MKFFYLFVFLFTLSITPFKAVCQTNYGLAFDGNDDYLNLGVNFNYQVFTIEMWINPDAVQVNWADIIDNNHGNTNFVVEQSKDTINQYGIGGNGVQAEIVRFRLQPNVWQHLAIVWAGTSSSAYVNGILVETKSLSAPIDFSNSILSIGRWYRGGRNWRGKIDELRIWNKTLSQSEIQSWMNKELTTSHTSYTNLVWYYKLNDGAAASTIAVDSKGTNNAPLNGFASTMAATNSTNSSGWIFSTVPRSTSQNKALSFDGINDYVSLDPAAINNLTQGTIETWVYLNSLDQEPIVSKQHDYVNTYSLLTIGYYQDQNHNPQDGDSGRVYFLPRNGILLSSNTRLTKGKWYHLAVTFNSSTATVYVDGVAAGSANANFSIPDDLSSGNVSRLGSWGIGFLDGILDGFRVWNVARTQQQILNGMHSDFLATTPNLLLNYSMNCTDSSSQIIDNSKRLLNGILGNTPNKPNFVTSSVIIDTNQSQCTHSALTFDGINNYVKAVAPSNDNYTIEAWVKPSNVINSSIIVATRSDGVAHSNQIAIKNGRFVHYLYDNIDHTLIGTTQIIANKWYHVAITASINGQMKLFVNGVQEGTPINIGNPEDETEIRFASSPVNSINFGYSFFNGVIEDVCMWNTQLTQAEIASWKDSINLSNHPKYANLIHYWKLEEGAGLATADAAGVVNGSLINMSEASWISSNSPISCNPVIYVFPQTISFAPLSDKIFGSTDTSFQISASASSGLPVSFTVKSGPATIDANNFVTINGAGTVTIEAKQAGDSNYSAATPVPRSFTVYKAEQTIMFNADSSSGGYILNATSSVGLPVSFSDSGYASITGNTLTFTGSGLVKVMASNAGNQNYEAASATKIFCIPASQPGSISGYQQACPGTQTYHIAALPGVIFSWSVSEGGTITSSNSNTITINWASLGLHTLSVGAFTSCDTSRKYSSLTVKVINNSLPATPANLYPDSGSVITAFPFSLSWQPATNTQFYDLYIWKDGLAQPTTPVIANTSQIGAAIYPDQIPGFAPSTKYRWRVDSKNGCGTTPSTYSSNFIISYLPNLKVKKVDVAPSAYAGSSIDVSVEIINIGNATTGVNAHWIDAIYLAHDSTLTSLGYTYLGGKSNIRTLAPGEFYSNTIRVQLPFGTIAGKWYIVVQTNDKSNNLAEVTRNDNKGNDTIQVLTPNVPDLKMQTPVTITPVFPFSGQQMQVHYTVKNTGTADAQNLYWKDYIYLSPDSGLNINTISSAIRIGDATYSNGILKKDSLYSVTAIVNLPVRIFGKMFIYVVANAESSFYEIFRNDNLAQTAGFTITLTPPPDFAVRNMNTPASAAGGETIAIDYSVYNYGASPPNRTEGSWADGGYISKDSVFNIATATLLRSTTPSPLPAMNIGEGYHNLLQVTIPPDITDSAYLYIFTDKDDNIFEYNKEDNNTARRKIKIINPDLVIDSIAVTDSALAGTTVNVEYRIRNNGPGKVLPFSRQDKIWISPSPVYNSANITLLSAQSFSNALDTAGSLLLQQEVIIPDTVSGPIRYLYIEADNPNHIAETNENNNRYRSSPTRITPATYPDLAASGVQLSAGSLLTDNKYAINYTVTNIGPADMIARTWTDRIYISQDAVWNAANAKEIKDFPQSMTLMQGASYTVTDSISIDLQKLNNQDSSRYYIYVFTDADYAIKEQGPASNNIAGSSQVSVSHLPFPDLIVTAATAADSARSGSRIIVTYKVKNSKGTYGFNSYWYDGVYFSTDPVLSDDDKLAGSKIITATLASDSSYQVGIYATVPNGYSGKYYMLLVTDYSKLNKDANRDNNKRVVAITVNNQPVPGPVYVTLTPPSDLVVSLFQVPSVGVAGQPVTVKIKVLNQQHSTTKSSWADKFFLSNSEQLSSSAQPLFTHQHTGSLDSAQFYIDSFQVFLPISAAGNYYLLGKTDANNVEYESDEVNNTKSSFIFVVQPLPSDLIVSEIFAPATATIGDSATITWIVKNIDSNAATGTMRQGIYFDSTPAILNDSATLLFSQSYQVNIPSLSTDTFTQKIKLRGINPGLQYASVRTDMQNNIPERNEQNNTNTSARATMVTVPQLFLNVVTPAILKNNDEVYYRIEVPDSMAGGAILLSLNGDSLRATNELYVLYGNIPTRITYDVAYDRSGSGSQQIVIPDLKKGTYYILAYGQSSLHSQQNISLLAEVINFKIRSIVTNQGGNNGFVTVKISGARFENGMQAVLSNDSLGRIIASRVIFINSTSLYATFNLANAKTGEYTAELIKTNSDSALLVKSFTVMKGSIGQVADNGGTNGFYCHITNIDADELLDLRENSPVSVSTWLVFPMRIEYGNSGNIDIAIQNYVLTCLNNLPVGESPDEILRALAQLLGGQLPGTLLNIFLSLKEPGLDVLRPGYHSSKIIFSAVPRDEPYIYRLLQQ